MIPCLARTNAFYMFSEPRNLDKNLILHIVFESLHHNEHVNEVYISHDYNLIVYHALKMENSDTK